jgi:glycosyltransferase involved in cell wall biosynthesis
MPKVSALIAVYNGERFIREAIESILDQTFKDVEIIVVDDGSTDRTREIVQAFGDRLIYYYQENAGADRAYNRGISLANGEFIAFLDHDDRWYPQKLAVQVEIFSRHPEVGLTYSEVDLIDADGAPVYKKPWTDRSGVRRDTIGDAVAILRERFPLSVPSPMLFRRHVLAEIGGFDTGLPRGGGHVDSKLCILAGEVSKVFFSIKPLVQYRVHTQQMTHGSGQLIHTSRLVFLDSLWARWRDKPEYRALLLPFYGRYWSKEGRRAFRRHEIDLASQYLKSSLRHRPRNFETWTWLARVQLHRLFSAKITAEDLN